MSDGSRPNEQFAEIKRLAEEFRVKAHLASMDARTAWDEDVKPQLKTLEAKFDKAVDDAKLSEEVSKLEKRLRKLVEEVVE